MVAICLLYGSAHAARGAAEDIAYVVRRLREVWPNVRIHVRGDTGFAVPRMYETCERLEVLYSIGIGMNARLKKYSESLLHEAVQRFEETGQSQRLFCAFWYRADTWPAQRWVVLKCEANAQGTNRRAVVTNRPGAKVLPEAAYDAYAERGESENRNKELKGGLQADRLSDHRYFANLFRLYLHTAAYHLLVRMRQQVVDPPPRDPHEPLAAEAFAGRRRLRDNAPRRRSTLLQLALPEALRASQSTNLHRHSTLVRHELMVAKTQLPRLRQFSLLGGKGALCLQNAPSPPQSTLDPSRLTEPRAPTGL